MQVEMRWHRQDGVRLPVALWCPGPGWRMISSGVAGGGIGMREPDSSGSDDDSKAVPDTGDDSEPAAA